MNWQKGSFHPAANLVCHCVRAARSSPKDGTEKSVIGDGPMRNSFLQPSEWRFLQMSFSGAENRKGHVANWEAHITVCARSNH